LLADNNFIKFSCDVDCGRGGNAGSGGSRGRDAGSVSGKLFPRAVAVANFEIKIKERAARALGLTLIAYQSDRAKYTYFVHAKKSGDF